MKNCPKCNTAHTKPGTFCSRKCSNSRVFTEESKKKKSIANAGRWTRKTPITTEEIRLRSAKTTAWALEKYQSTPFEKLGSENRKRRVLEEQGHKCNHCGISEWMGDPIVLELEHKDGDTKNNDRSNLECICPNCHSKTKTWRGRNNKKRIVPDEVLLEAVKKHNTISEALRSVGLPDKGASHARAKRLLSH
jgi:5-methylcytosine-specific restriction endonuclease McrA